MKKKKKKLFWGWTFFIIILFLIFYNINNGIKNYLLFTENQKRYQELNTKIIETKNEEKWLKNEIEKMKDPKYVELKLIEKYKLKYKGEKVIEFIQ